MCFLSPELDSDSTKACRDFKTLAYVETQGIDVVDSPIRMLIFPHESRLLHHEFIRDSNSESQVVGCSKAYEPIQVCAIAIFLSCSLTQISYRVESLETFCVNRRRSSARLRP